MTNKERKALEMARHELITLHSRIAAGGVAPKEMRGIVTTAVIAAIDDALNEVF